jgi:hypothetical protein
MSTPDCTEKEKTQQPSDSATERKLPTTDKVLGLVGGDILKSCSLGALECAVISAYSLRDELNSPEEDEAWRDFNPEM